MQKYLRLIILTGTLALAAPLVFADSGPGDGDPPPPSVPTPHSTSATPTSSVIALLLSYLGL